MAWLARLLKTELLLLVISDICILDHLVAVSRSVGLEDL